MTRAHFIGAVIGALLLALPAHAKNEVPSPMLQEVLIKSTLLSLNDANLTGNYTVVHAKTAKPFREQISPDRMKEIFKTFVDKHIDWAIIAAKPPVNIKEPYIDDRGALIFDGYFDTQPNRVYYQLEFLPSEGKWKPIRLNVNVKPAGEK